MQLTKVSQEQFETELKSRIKNYTDCINIYNILEQELKKFDGKQINKRIVTYLKTLDGLQDYESIYIDGSHLITHNFKNKNMWYWNMWDKENPQIFSLQSFIKNEQGKIDNLKETINQYKYLLTKVDTIVNEYNNLVEIQQTLYNEYFENEYFTEIFPLMKKYFR